MKKLYTFVLIIVVLLFIWSGFDYFRSKSNANETKKVFQEFITTNYSENELPTMGDRLAIVALRSPETFASLTFENVVGPNKNSISFYKTRLLMNTVGYSAKRFGADKKVFNKFLQTVKNLIDTDSQNKETYLGAVEYFLVNSASSCISGGLGDLRPKFIREMCFKRNDPLILIRDTLGKYGDDINNELKNFKENSN